jgi:hypothetical protein
MFAVDLRAVRTPHGLAGRLQSALSAVRPSVLSVTQRPNATLCHKEDQAFTRKKSPAPHAQTVRRSTRFPSAPCALFSHSFPQERKSSPSFSMACARFWRRGGYPAHRKINGSNSMVCKLRKRPGCGLYLQPAQKNDAKERAKQPNNSGRRAANKRSTPDAATASLCYCFWSPVRHCAACLTHH